MIRRSLHRGRGPTSGELLAIVCMSTCQCSEGDHLTWEQWHEFWGLLYRAMDWQRHSGINILVMVVERKAQTGRYSCDAPAAGCPEAPW
jgi:hypothetical protein